MKILLITLCLALTLCSTTTPPRTIGSHAPAAKSKTVVVDANWMAKYKEGEAKYNARIPQDSEIKSEGDKFRVPQAVIDHNLDLTKAVQTHP